MYAFGYFSFTPSFHSFLFFPESENQKSHGKSTKSNNEHPEPNYFYTHQLFKQKAIGNRKKNRRKSQHSR
jgi:hypothetical protein